MIWLMTDERISDEALMQALTRLPRGAGVVFRHYSLGAKPRRALFDQIRAFTRRHGLVLLLAGSSRTARAWRADGWHGRSRGPRRMLHSAAVHDRSEMEGAEQAGADFLFLSPVFATRSHPGAPGLGRVRFALLVQQAGRPVIALGGMTRQRWRGMRQAGATGWAAIDAWSATGPTG